ncbi:unnamed protein product [Orchesella dallaii]|uniref:Uncharacterized protein n=1 Tax=Orchesella dallaii TaxID=48710 RepID=A0ABP1QSD7_9HEXA
MNMITIFCVSALILACQISARPQDANAAAAAAPATGEKSANITLLKNDVKPLDGQGSYSYDIELSDGTKLVQSGHTEAPGMGETESSIIIEGSYSYVAPDGKQISITYIADKNGFQPKGDAIPTVGNSTSSDSAAAAAPASPPAAAPAPAAAEAPAAADAPAAVESDAAAHSFFF